jgi:hypothetical protein
MLTQPPVTAAASAPAMPLDATAPLPTPKTFWERADDITGFVLFMAIIAGGIFVPFALYLYGLLFR